MTDPTQPPSDAPRGPSQGAPRTGQRSRAYAADPAAPGHACDVADCLEAGNYRAPKSRSQLNDYHWFCLDHVRAYNAGWDFYKGMSPDEIEAQMRHDTAWQRPTWPLGRLGRGFIEEDMLHDPLNLLATGKYRRGSEPRNETPAELREPLATLGLNWPTTLEQAKSRWKALAKAHHPDANGGNRAAEERLKTINLAYAAVRTHLAAVPSPAASAV